MMHPNSSWMKIWNQPTSFRLTSKRGAVPSEPFVNLPEDPDHLEGSPAGKALVEVTTSRKPIHRPPLGDRNPGIAGHLKERLMQTGGALSRLALRSLAPLAARQRSRGRRD